MEFYLLRNGERAGPFKIFHIVAMLRDNEVEDTDLAWCSTDDQWMPLKDIPALKGLVSDPVDDNDVEDAPAAQRPKTFSRKTVAASDAARPWMRYIARTLDCSIMFAIFAVAAVQLGFAGPGVFTETKDLLTVAGLHVLSSYAWVFIEAWLLTTYGATFGKLLFNIQVVHEDGSKLTYPEALRRSLTVWLRGYGLGVFPFREMLCVMSFIALVQDGKTPWDERQSLKVTHASMKRARWITLIAIMISLLTLKSFVAYKIDPDFRKVIHDQIEERQAPRDSNPLVSAIESANHPR